MVKRILFVCTGNTCRSPLAEGLLRGMANREGVPLEVRSAGVSAMDGQPVSRHSGDILREKGASGTFTSKSVTRELIEWADLVLTMTLSHKRSVVQRYPEAVEKIYTLKEYVLDDPGVLQSATDRTALLTELQMKHALGQPISQAELVKLQLLEEQAPDVDIADPFGGSRRDYQEASDEIEACLAKLVAKVKSMG